MGLFETMLYFASLWIYVDATVQDENLAPILIHSSEADKSLSERVRVSRILKLRSRSKQVARMCFESWRNVGAISEFSYNSPLEELIKRVIG